MAENYSPIKGPGKLEAAADDDVLISGHVKAPAGQDLKLEDDANGIVTLSTILTGLGLSEEVEDAILQGDSSGVLSLLGIALDIGRNFTINPGVAKFVNSYDIPITPTVDVLSYAGASGVALTTTGNSPETTITYIGLNKFGSIIQTPGTPTLEDMRSVVYLGYVWHPGGDTGDILAVRTYGSTGAGAVHDLYDFRHALGPLRESGLIFAPNGANLNLDVGAGVLSNPGEEGWTSSTSRQRVGRRAYGAVTVTSFYRAYRDASNSITTDATSTAFTPGVYDDGSGTPAAFPAGDNWSVAWCFTGAAGSHVVLLGQYTYATKAAAIANIGRAMDLRGSYLEEFLPTTWLVYNKAATALNDTNDAEFYGIPRLFRHAATGIAAQSVGGLTTRIATTVVTQPHAIRDEAAAVIRLDVAGEASKVAAQFPINTDAAGGSFTFRIKVGPIGGAYTTIDDVTITQGTSDATASPVSPVAFSAGEFMVVEQIAVGDFPASTPAHHMRATIHMYYDET